MYRSRADFTIAFWLSHTPTLLTKSKIHRNCDVFEVCDLIASVLAMIAHIDVSEIGPVLVWVFFLQMKRKCSVNCNAFYYTVHTPIRKFTN